MEKYKVYAEDMGGKRRYLDTAEADNGGNGLFGLYADECGDEEQIVIVPVELSDFASALSKSKAGKPKAAQASRENAKKGGRPCSHANADGSARPWELRRFKAGHACHSCGRTLGTDGYWYIDADQAPGYPFDKTARKG